MRRASTGNSPNSPAPPGAPERRPGHASRPAAAYRPAAADRAGATPADRPAPRRGRGSPGWRCRRPDTGRLTAGPILVDACCLVGPLHRGLILAAAEATGHRLAWSARIVAEAEYGIGRMLAGRGGTAAALAALHADLARCAGLVVAGDSGLPPLLPPGLPPLRDPGDAHVLAAALAAGAGVILTENRRDFPLRLLRPLGLRAVATNSWMAERLACPAVVAAITRRWPPEPPPGAVLAALRAAGLVRTAAALRRINTKQ